jgi:LEA14-like dessication related protein
MRQNIVLVSVLAGCSGAPAPVLELDRVELVDADYAWVELGAVFALDNPRPLQSELSAFSFVLEVAGEPWVTGEGVSLLRTSEENPAELVLPLGLAYSELYAEQRPTRGSDSLPARLSFEASLDRGDGPAIVDDAQEVELLALRPPELRPVALVVTPRGEDQVELRFTVSIDNDMGSELSVSAAELELSVDGVPVFTEPFQTPAPVPAAGVVDVELVTTLDPSEGGATLVAALEAGEALVGLDAELVVEGEHGNLPDVARAEAVLRF